MIILNIRSSTVNSDLQSDVKAEQCILTEPVYGTKFDLNPLRSTMSHKLDANGQDFIEFNVCTNFTKECAGVKSAACFKKNGSDHKFGEFLFLNNPH